MKRIGLLGGSFNPGHGGHRRVSIAAARALGLDEIWWLVSPGNPLKPGRGMAPVAARYLSASRAARVAPVRVTVIECELGSVYTVDTLRALARRYPGFQFVWLMGADNLASFHRWKDWRGIARAAPIAVVTRPGYEGDALMAPAMGWLRRFVRPVATLRDRTKGSPPSLVLLRMPPDRTSATAIRAAHPQWHETYPKSFNPIAHRDGVTRRPLGAERNPGRRTFAPIRTRSA